MIVRSYRFVLAAVAACAAMSVGCVVASGDGNTDPGSTPREDLAHTGIGANATVSTASPKVPEKTVTPDFAPLGTTPTATPTPQNNGGGLDFGFSTPSTAPTDPNDPVAVDPNPHPWEPPGEPAGGTTKPKIGGAKDDDGSKPTK